MQRLTVVLFLFLFVGSLCSVVSHSGFFSSLYSGTVQDGLINNGFCNADRDCMNSGKCDSTGICQCMEGYKNDLSLGIINCSLIDCAHNGTKLNGSSGCLCAEGWEGENCLCKLYWFLIVTHS